MEESGMEENCEIGCAELPQMQLQSIKEAEEHWQTVTRNSYPAPTPNMSKSMGRRRELIKKCIALSVFGETMNDIASNFLPQPTGPSEYVDNFCDSKFIPFMNKTEYDVAKHSKYPLHGGATVQSYYKCQFDKGTLKNRSEISDLNQPFRRSCSFTTPPELTFKQPMGGY